MEPTNSSSSSISASMKVQDCSYCRKHLPSPQNIGSGHVFYRDKVVTLRAILIRHGSLAMADAINGFVHYGDVGSL